MLNDGKIFKGNLFDYFLHINAFFKKTFTDNDICIALREALLNALINADYTNLCEISVETYASHISFTNSGTFLVDITDAKNGFVSTPRNPLIKKFFDLIKPIDIFTSGLSYIHMIWQKNGWSAPYFQQNDNKTILKLYFYNIDIFNNPPDVIKSETIICYLTEHIFADIQELSKILNLQKNATEKIISKMFDNDIIITVQKNNNLLYKLKD